jgi:gentisate 1,2-dioxygenase
MLAATLPPDALRRRADYYARIGTAHMTPLWEVLGALVPPHPRSPASPHLWRYADLRQQVMEAGSLISAEEAEGPIDSLTCLSAASGRPISASRSSSHSGEAVVASPTSSATEHSSPRASWSRTSSEGFARPCSRLAR